MYIEELIILNFIIDYILLKTMSKILKLQTTNKKIILSSLVGEITLIYLFISNMIIISVTKILILSLMIYISFGFNDKKTYIKNIIYYYIISFFLGGTLYYIKTNNLNNYKYFLLLVPIIMNIYEYFEYDIKRFIQNRYKVNIYLNDGTILYLNGFMDTGNNLVEPYTNKKVIIINKKVNENFYLVPYKTVSGEALIKCFTPKKVYIDGLGEINNISVGICDEKFNGYNCLLNYKIMEEIW